MEEREDVLRERAVERPKYSTHRGVYLCDEGARFCWLARSLIFISSHPNDDMHDAIVLRRALL
jgi:hypothetical protein